MNPKVVNRFRVGIATIVGAVAGIVTLKIGDNADPLTMPSWLYQPAIHNIWAYELPWLALAGLVIGGTTALAWVFDFAPSLQENVGTIVGSCVLLTAILAFARFSESGTPLTVSNFGTVFGFDVFYFTFTAIFPAFIGAFFIHILIAPLTARRRSAVEIMPTELRERYLREQAERKQQPLLQRIFYRPKKPA